MRPHKADLAFGQNSPDSPLPGEFFVLRRAGKAPFFATSSFLFLIYYERNHMRERDGRELEMEQKGNCSRGFGFFVRSVPGFSGFGKGIFCPGRGFDGGSERAASLWSK